MSASTIDPDIQAAFAGRAAATAPVRIDDDVAAAFKPSAEGSVEIPPLSPEEDVATHGGAGLELLRGTRLAHMAKDVVGSVAHGAGTLIDVGRNVIRTAEGEPTIPYGSPGSTAALLSGPFQHAPDVEQPPDVKEQIRRGLPKLTDVPAVKSALESPAGTTLTQDVIKPAMDIGQAALAAVPLAKGLRAGEVAAPEIADTSARQSIGAAASTTDLTAISPELRAAVDAAKGNVNEEALARHVRAETLPMPDGETPLRLRRGQATQDAQQISDEKNLRADPETQGILTDSINEQNRKLVDSMGEIRRRATPDIVQRNNLEHGQAQIDSIKSVDNAAVTDIRAKYKALADANGGNIPIDTGATIAGIDAELGKKFLTKTAGENGVVSSVIDSLRSGAPMSFEAFENARTGLAAVQRAGGPEGVAAGIVHDALERMPLSAEAAPLKAMADTARSAAAARFKVIRDNPAYKAAVEDDVPKDQNGLHVIGAASPLADSFMDRYFLGNGPNASRAYVARMKGVMGSDPQFSQSIEAAALNRLRGAAGIDELGTGGFNYASYRNARNAMEPKSDVLLSPESRASTQQLNEVAGDVNSEPKGASTNRSNTAVTLQRFGAEPEKTTTIKGELAGKAADLGAATLGPKAIGAKKILDTVFSRRAEERATQALKDAKLKFATDATAPGAGIAKE